MPADIAGDLTAAGGVPDQDDVVQIERFDDGGEVVGVVVEVVALPRLPGPASASPIVEHGPIPMGGNEVGWSVPGVRGQRPPVAEDHGLAGAPVLEEDVDAVGGGDNGHFAGLSWVNGIRQVCDCAVPGNNPLARHFG